MRAFALALVLALVPLAGCVTPASTRTPGAPELSLPALPEGATSESIDGGLRLVFDAVELPFERNVTLPDGTTIVRATGIVGRDEAVSVTLRHAETLRRRCNLAPLDAWDAPVLGRAQCSGVTVVDRLPDAWQVRATSDHAGKARIELDLLATPLDGILARLDLSQLSMRDFTVKGTEVLRLPSFDGTELHVEVTLPEGPGPWPTIVSSSPYNHADRMASGKPAMWSYFTRDWVERGYAVVNADVRGYGWSEGCVEVWGPREQLDQSFLVEWAAQQPWSDGRVGFYGQSYVGTTPVEAAVQAPEALKAIIVVAPVVDAYNDWHFGGVPNGEGLGSPIAYYQTGAPAPSPEVGSTEPADQLALAEETLVFAQRVDNALCDPTLIPRANDPRAVYNEFYAERNFSARAGDVRAAVLYTEGFEDSNVKSAEIPDWFNALPGPKLGLFGHWVHQHPTRADNEALFLLWLDQHVKGRPVGFEDQPAARIVSNDGRERVADAWPPLDAPARLLHLDPAGGALTDAPAEGSATFAVDPAAGTLPIPPGGGVLPAATSLEMTSAPFAEAVRFGGQPQVHVAVEVERAENAYLAAFLYEETSERSALVTWGMFNLAHREGHDAYAPVPPGERVHVGIPLLPTEWTVASGATLRLVVRGASVADWSALLPGEPATVTLHADGSALALPLVPEGAPLPATAQR